MLAFIHDVKLQVSIFGYVLKAKLQWIVFSWRFECEPFTWFFSYMYFITLHGDQSFNSLNKTKSLNFSCNLFCNGKPKLWKGCKNVKIALCVRVRRIRGVRQTTWRLSSSSIRNVTHIYQGDHQSKGGGRKGGAGGHSTKCYTGGSAPRSNPLTFYIPFLTKKVRAPLSYAFYCNLLKPKFKMLNPFNCCKCTVT